MRILLTRPEADAKTSAERLAALGHEALICPLFEIIPTTSAALPEGPFTALLATSAHAFDALATNPRVALLPLHVVGERTASAAKRAGFQQIMNVAADAEKLTQKLTRDGNSRQHFLYLAGRERRPELEEMLQAQGHAITPSILYRTRPVDALPAQIAQGLRDQQIEAVLHFSPRSAALFLDLADKAGLRDLALAPLHVAISARTAQELKPAHTLRIAATPDFEGLAACLAGA